MIEKEAGTIIVTAQSFNPSIFSQLWLVKQKIVEEGEFQGNSISSTELAQHRFADIQLLCLPPRLQLSFSSSSPEAAQRACRVAGLIVEKLPHTPFGALGINFEHIVSPQDTKNSVDGFRQLFLVENTPLSRFFDDGQPRFGGYFSRDFEGSRLKLVITPILPTGQFGSDERLKCDYNFHVDMNALEHQDRSVTIIKSLKRWSDYNQTALKLTRELISAEGISNE
jgi:hypothetical protein